MTNTAEANYFDGQSSASQQATVVLDDTPNELRLQTTAGASLVWKLGDLQFEQYGRLLEIRNKNHTGALLKVDDEDFSHAFYATMKRNKQVDIHTRLSKLSFAKILAIAIVLLGGVVLVYLYVLPPVAERTAALLPTGFDDQLGDTFMETFLDYNDLDTTKTEHLRQFASELNLNNQKPLHFSVVVSDEVNAFALPNGQIVIFSAILEDMQSADELAALLGHEASHVNQRHSIKMLCRNLAGYLVVSQLLSDVNGIVTVLADNAHQLHSLSYSRKFEQEADEQGLKILIDNGMDPYGMVRLFEQLEEKNEYDVPKIMSSHPLTKDRKEHMEKIISSTVYEVEPHAVLNALFEKIKGSH